MSTPRLQAAPPTVRIGTHDLRTSLTILLGYWWTGVLDSLRAWPHSLLVVYASRTIRRRVLQCFLLNGLVFLGSMAVYHGTIQPILRWWWLPVVVPGSSSSSLDSSSDTLSPTTALRLVYHLLWLWPVYVLSFLLNALWYQDIADRCHQLGAHAVSKQRRSTADATTSTTTTSTPSPTGAHSRPAQTFVRVLTDEIYRNLLSTNFLLLITCVYFVPYGIGPALSFLGACWLYALYCFEYTWIHRGWSVESRLLYFEERWAYFLGFGWSSALITYWFPQFIGAGMFALLFPLYVIVASAAKPVPSSNLHIIPGTMAPEHGRPLHHLVPHQLPIFAIPKRINLLLMRHLQSKAHA